MKKKGFVFGLMAVLAAAVLVLAGCGGPKAEDVIREGVTAEFDKIKNLDDSLIDEMTSEMDSEEASAFTELGIDMKDYLKNYFAGFDYEVGEIEVDEDAGTGTVQMRRPASRWSGSWPILRTSSRRSSPRSIPRT